MNNVIKRYEVEPFCCECSLMEDVIDTLFYIYDQKYEDYSSVAVICNENLTEKIMKYVLGNYDVEVDYIKFDKFDYDDVYGICLYIEDDELHFSIEEATGKDKYKTFDMDYLYISADVNKDFLRDQDIKNTEIDIFRVMDDCE